MAGPQPSPLIDSAHVEKGSFNLIGDLGNGTFNQTNQYITQVLKSVPPLVSNVPGPPVHYVPRPELMASLTVALQGDGTAFVTGQAVASGDGGQGKTVIAEAYAFEHAADYPGGRFIIGCEGGVTTAALAALLPEFDSAAGLTDDQRAALVKTRLSEHPRCLLILDNIIENDQWCTPTAKALLPVHPCHVLITTRAERLAGVKAVPVGRLSESEAISLLKRFRDSADAIENRAAVTSILRDIEHLAATIAAVGAIMFLDEDDDWTGYAEHLASSTVAHFPDSIEQVRQETGYAGKTVVVLDDLRSRLPDAELRVLDYAAILPADQIIPRWLDILLKADADESRGEAQLDIGKNFKGIPRSSADVIAHLLKLDLLRPVGKGGEILTVHRLHRRRSAEILSDRTELREKLLNAIGTLGCAWGLACQSVAVDKALRIELTPLVALATKLKESGRLAEALTLANLITSPLMDLARLAEAKSLLEMFVNDGPALLERVGPEPTASLLSNFAMVLREFGVLLIATEIIKRAIKINQKHLPLYHPTLALRYSNLATILRPLGKLAEAKFWMERAIAIHTKHIGADALFQAIGYSNFAMILLDLREFAEARIWIEKAIAINEKHLKPDDPAFAILYSNHASVLIKAKELTKARLRMEQSIAILERYYEVDHPNLANGYSNLAITLHDLGDAQSARSYFHRAIAIEEKALDSDNPLLAIRYNNLAYLEADEGHFRLAVELEEKAMSIRRKRLHESHPHFRQSVRDLQKMKEVAAMPTMKARREWAKHSQTTR